jgi:hypothetical protein
VQLSMGEAARRRRASGEYGVLEYRSIGVSVWGLPNFVGSFVESIGQLAVSSGPASTLIPQTSSQFAGGIKRLRGAGQYASPRGRIA